MAYIIDIDTGGTFTDGFIAKDGDVRTVKVPTTPHDLTLCFLECIKAAAQAFDVSIEDLLYETDIIRFSNTIGTNTIIQRDGAKIGLMVSRGMGDHAPTGSEADKAPLVSPEMVLELDEQTDASGQVVAEPQPTDILHAAQTLIDRGARVLVVALEHSELNPANERKIREVIRREYPSEYLGAVSVFLASDISTRSGLAERLNTAALNAYIHPKLARLLYKAGEELRQRDYQNTLFIGHNNGSVARVAKTRAINTYNSGPAAGLLGAREIGALYGIDNLVSTDMGGTSFDIGCVKDGVAGYSLEPDVEGFACNLPMMSILALGTGGGSIAHISDGELKVGPQSAGALPGPACFNLGGKSPTVTDANLVLGILDPEYFLGGEMALDVERARTAIKDAIAEPLGTSVEEAAWRIKQIVDRDMGAAVGGVADTLSPANPRTVVAYGGAGGLHACDIATAAGADKVIITPFAAVSSAYSSSLLDPGHLYYRRVDLTAGRDDFATIAGDAVSGMRREAVRDMRGEGFEASELRDELQLFLANTNGKEILLHVDSDFASADDQVTAAFDRAAELLDCPGDELVLETMALMVRAQAPHYRLSEESITPNDPSGAIRAMRDIYSPRQGSYVEVAVYERDKLKGGAVVSGPALIDSSDTTLYVPEEWQVTVDGFNNMIIEGAEA